MRFARIYAWIIVALLMPTFVYGHQDALLDLKGTAIVGLPDTRTLRPNSIGRITACASVNMR